MTPSLFRIIETGRQVESEEIKRKFGLVSDYLSLQPEYVLADGKMFIDLVVGAINLGLDPYIAFGFFHCIGNDSDPAHRAEYALVIGDRKQCPIHPLTSVTDETAHEAIVELRKKLD